jgi:alkanesulfonate monooxygenase SsuD/methylene tetrahydromethanopterin reductase-like flavin-dependent oxidoreductase (luciferase family)
MRYSLMTEPQLGGTYDDLLRFARHAETLGLVSFARSDHLAWRGAPMPATDAFATLGALARETETIRLCVLVTPITFRHPAIIAKNAATIDQMSGGRLDLGVGTGWNEHEHDVLGLDFPGQTERWRRFEDSLGYLTAAFSEPSTEHRGPYYSLATDVLPKPSGIRIVIGGSGPKRTPTFAGRYADEYNTYIGDPKGISTRVSVMREAAGDRQVEVTVMGSVETGSRARLSEQILSLEEAGVERVYLQWLDLTDFAGMAAMVDEVLSL